MAFQLRNQLQPVDLLQSNPLVSFLCLLLLLFCVFVFILLYIVKKKPVDLVATSRYGVQQRPLFKRFISFVPPFFHVSSNIPTAEEFFCRFLGTNYRVIYTPSAITIWFLFLYVARFKYWDYWTKNRARRRDTATENSDTNVFFYLRLYSSN